MLFNCYSQYEYVSKFGNSVVATGLEKASFHSDPKEGQSELFPRGWGWCVFWRGSGCFLGDDLNDQGNLVFTLQTTAFPGPRASQT